MKKITLTLTMGFILAISFATAHADLDLFLTDLNVNARADLPGFKAELSGHFGVPMPRVENIFHTVSTPADAYICLQLGQWLHLPPEQVVHSYQRNKGRGWGVIAKDLGIKPGSAEFHALKNGNLPAYRPNRPIHQAGHQSSGQQGKAAKKQNTQKKSKQKKNNGNGHNKNNKNKH